MKYLTNKYPYGTPLIKYLNFDKYVAFGMIVSKTFSFYIVEWYMPKGQIETESCVEQSIKHYRDNYNEYRINNKVRKGKVGEE